MLATALRGRIRLPPVAGVNGEPMYQLAVPIAFDRILTAAVPGLPIPVASPTGHALMYGDDSIRIELAGDAKERAA